jgi:poly-gamma-glutamate synthesis protein (capsule biosynthesis protein)
MSEALTVVAVGDLLIRDEAPEYLFDSTRHIFKSADIAYCNVEQPYAYQYPKMARILAENVGFNVGAFANNHALDHGEKVFLDTIQQLRDAGIATFGGGRNIAEARAPAIVECKGTKIAFLAYTSIQVPSYQATATRAGCAPLKVHTSYHPQFEEAPGCPPAVRTIADQHDLEAMLDDIRKAKTQVDIVVLTLHWGPTLQDAVINEYQPSVAHAAIDAGADVIFGHHPHIMKGIEVYKGKTIFYSMNHFILKLHQKMSKDYVSYGFVTNKHVRNMMRTYRGEYGYYEDYPYYPFGPTTLPTIIVKLKISQKRITSVSYLPCKIGMDCAPRLLKWGEPDFYEVSEQVERFSREMELPVYFSRHGDEISVGPSR